MLVDVISLELVQDNQDEELEEYFLSEEHEGQPEQNIERGNAVRAVALGIALRCREEHVEIPIFTW